MTSCSGAHTWARRSRAARSGARHRRIPKWRHCAMRWRSPPRCTEEATGASQLSCCWHRLCYCEIAAHYHFFGRRLRPPSARERSGCFAAGLGASTDAGRGFACVLFGAAADAGMRSGAALCGIIGLAACCGLCDPPPPQSRRCEGPASAHDADLRGCRSADASGRRRLPGGAPSLPPSLLNLRFPCAASRPPPLPAAACGERCTPRGVPRLLRSTRGGG